MYQFSFSNKLGVDSEPASLKKIMTYVMWQKYWEHDYYHSLSHCDIQRGALFLSLTFSEQKKYV